VSDDQLPALERRFRETGAVDDEAAWIAARVRAGRLAPARVTVAALCGHEAARLADIERTSKTVDEAAALFGVEPATLRRWVRRGCPSTGAGGTLALDIVSVSRWREARARRPGERHNLLMVLLAAVDPEAAKLARTVAGVPQNDAVRRALVDWVLSGTCPTCRGSGLVRCRTCDGAGEARVGGYPDSWTLRCDACNATGKTVCPTCREPPAPPRAPRFRVEDGPWQDYNLDDHFRKHRVTEVATGRVVLVLEERRHDANFDSDEFAGVSAVRIDDDGLHVVVTHHDGRVQRVSLRPPPPARFRIEVVEVSDGADRDHPWNEHRVVETATGNVVLKFVESPDWSHPWDPSYEGAASVKIEDGETLVRVAYHGGKEDERVVLPPRPESRWPAFAERVLIDGSRAWTAEFESYDRRLERCFYVVTLYESEWVRRIMAEVDTGTESDLGAPAFVEGLRARLGEIAATAKSNTEYLGYGNDAVPQ
jgi:hypothetical protein